MFSKTGFHYKQASLFLCWLPCYTAEDDTHEVYGAVLDLAGMWHDMCLALGLRPAVADTIAATHPQNPKQCLREVIVEWLRKTYDVSKHGPPTWRTLVKAVSDKAGGNNPALAEEIAEKHKGIVTIRPRCEFCTKKQLHIEQVSSAHGLNLLSPFIWHVVSTHLYRSCIN